MRLSRMIAMVVRTVIVAGIACLVASGPMQASAMAVTGPSQSNGVSDKAVQLLKRVHQASLVERWAGERAGQFSSNASVKWVGRNLLADQTFFDRKVVAAGEQFGVDLPNEPDLQQQAGMRKMARVSGAEFDRAFANVLHFGNTRILPLAKAVVAEDSPNPVVRQIGQLGVTLVSKHIAWLEATGMVTAALSPGVTAAQQASLARETAGVQTYSNTVPAMVGLGSLGALLLAVAYLVLRPRRAEVPAREGRGSRARGSSSRQR
jgi:putative membrane protein